MRKVNYALPVPGEVWERDGLQRKIVDLKRNSPFPDDQYVHWERPKGGAERVIYLAYWREWRSRARLVNEELMGEFALP